MSKSLPPDAVCAGVFGPCTNTPDPAYTLDDPDGVGPSIPRCRTCAEAGEAFFDRVEKAGKLPQLDFAIEAARLRTTNDRGKS